MLNRFVSSNDNRPEFTHEESNSSSSTNNIPKLLRSSTSSSTTEQLQPPTPNPDLFDFQFLSSKDNPIINHLRITTTISNESECESVSTQSSSLYHRHKTSLYPSSINTTDITNNLDAIATPISSREIVTTTTASSFDTCISRYLPQNQAVITTQDNWRISLLNQIATMILSGLQRDLTEQDFIGKHILDFIDVNYRPLLLDKIVKMRDDSPQSYHLHSHGIVLICGDIIPIIKQDGTKSSASLWLKEKKNENGSSIFIWIFEEVSHSTIKILLNENNLIQSVNEDNDAIELFGYTSLELIQQPIQKLIPHYDKTSLFFGGRTKRDAYFPVMIGHIQNRIRITSMPTLAGLVTVDRESMKIQSSNHSHTSSFCKHLFGYEHIDHMSLAILIPLYPRLIELLERDHLLDEGYVLNNSICHHILLNEVGQPLMARHRDGSEFEIDIQIKLLDSTTYALWITFDRDAVFTRYGHTTSSIMYSSSQQKDSYSTTIVRSKSINLPAIYTKRKKSSIVLNRPTIITTATNTKNVMGINTCSIKEEEGVVVSGPIHLESSVEQQQQQQQQLRPVSMGRITSFSRPSFFSSVEKNEVKDSFHSHSNRFHIQQQQQQSTPDTKDLSSIWPRLGEYSAQTLKTNIHNYEIVDELGQGAYGVVKLAYLKSDPQKKRVVIKYIIKSRILVDCWIRDRKLGLIPAEIHVLHTLRKIPHINCSDMLDYFEDEDNYYVVMDLYGAGMDLFDYIELKEGGMTETEIRDIFRQIAEAVRHLHDHRIVHRDIKDENVILDLNGGVRLIDFGSAAYLKESKQFETFVGTLDYAAPEILKGQAYSGPPQDIWACGTLLYTLIYRENPFYNIEEIMERELRIPFVISEESVDLIRKMLDRNVNKRINIHQVLEHSWFHAN
ncbi:kinase-like domain-containing protein [Cokeromyces recurvatus]|uniref:kinase-like domain-containing protein n=1 Tax=Cokeromyces recurvatus TaxID=90255 RepID=UPI002220C25E|nr:kinase-like domain-containing protein [Cokeromyces recurvatus]KAI7899810.1 kinase-like domain-containing protein [Cokeromyces recurvatus]